MTIVTLDYSRCKVQTIDGDGNCLFAAIVHQIYRYVKSVMHKALTMALREEVVSFLHDNTTNEHFMSVVLWRVDEDFPSLIGKDDAETYMDFLRELQKDGVWGALETHIAVAHMFESDVWVYREMSSQERIASGGINLGRVIKLVYCGRPGHWNHYDSFISFVDETINMCGSAVDERKMNPYVRYTAWYSTVTYVGGSCVVLKTKPDGSCMFSALAQQLFGLDVAKWRY